MKLYRRFLATYLCVCLIPLVFSLAQVVGMRQEIQRSIAKDQEVTLRTAQGDLESSLVEAANTLDLLSENELLESLSLEYFVGEAFAGQGLMTEALGAVVPYAFQTLGAPVLSARVFRENKASQRVLEKLGFTREGLLRRAVRCPGGQVHDDVPFSLLRQEWEASQRE